MRLVGVWLIIALFVGFTLGNSLIPVQEVSSSVTLLSDGDYFPAVLSELNSASLSLDIALLHAKYYEDFPGSKENQLVEALAAAKERGVRVRVVLDDQGASQDDNAFDFLESNGVSVKYDSPDSLNHNKFIIIDSKAVVVGSTNWSYSALEKNRETSVLIRSTETANEFNEYFEDLWVS
ncbi:MAG: hypothetical protein GOV15_01435, partial [Candidatus Diapherotrites archaeon]|nr:hypothetical protein [Candidatus Diapherotrites archaeon]